MVFVEVEVVISVSWIVGLVDERLVLLKMNVYLLGLMSEVSVFLNVMVLLEVVLRLVRKVLLRKRFMYWLLLFVLIVVLL